MELATAEMVERLLSGSPQRPVSHGRCSPATARAGSLGPWKTLRARPRCRCGKCRQCQDDARWERIFAEKFADPDYYAPRIVRFSSPLA